MNGSYLCTVMTVIAVAAVLSLIVLARFVKAVMVANKRLQSQSSGESNESNSAAIALAPPYYLVRARHGWMLANPNDFYIGRSFLEYGEHGELESQLLVKLPAFRPGKVVEVGANVGAHTVPLANALALERREMVVFEPQPFIFQNLCANLAINGLTNVRAWPWACGAQTEVVYLTAPDYMAQGNFGGVSVGADAAPKSIPVPCVRLDDVIGSDPVSVLKIDVEGYELRTLEGAIHILSASRPLVYVENDRVEKSKTLIEWLWSRNYRLFWHIPRLFNSENFFAKNTNIYGTTASFNMVGVPRELEISIQGLSEIESSTDHPLVG